MCSGSVVDIICAQSSFFCLVVILNDTATSEIDTLSIDDALPIDESGYCASEGGGHGGGGERRSDGVSIAGESELPSEAQTSRTKPPASAFAFAL